jgi:hypothetical protein
VSLLPGNLQQAAYINPSIPVGCGFDILNGVLYKGLHRQFILSGGLSYIMGIAAKGNVGKSTLAEWFMYTAMCRVTSWEFETPSAGIFYDTEINKNEPRMTELQLAIKGLCGRDLFSAGRFSLTNKVQYSGNKFFDMIKDWLDAKRKDRKNSFNTPFADRGGKTNFKMFVPTFCAVDSLSEFDTDDIDKVRDKTELGTGDQNILNMRAGLVKANFLTELPRVTIQANNYTVLVAQMGKNMDVGASPHAPKPQQLKNLPASEAIKGATAKFTFATHDCWWIESSAPLWDDEMKPEYVIEPAMARSKDTDLQKTKLKQLRSKGGPSGVIHEILVSQKNGIQPELTEFHYLRSCKRWGMEVSGGGGSIMEMQLYPGVKVSRHTVRTRIDEDPLFCKALNFTMEMKQMEEHWPYVTEEGWFVDPAELYRGLTARGYDWKVLLNTRGYWCLGEGKVPELCTFDLWRMYHGGYHPYWYDKAVGAEAAKKVNKGPLEAFMSTLHLGPLLIDLREAKEIYGFAKPMDAAPELKPA